jgi:hypothetical protein
LFTIAASEVFAKASAYERIYSWYENFNPAATCGVVLAHKGMSRLDSEGEEKKSFSETAVQKLLAYLFIFIYLFFRKSAQSIFSQPYEFTSVQQTVLISI